MRWTQQCQARFSAQTADKAADGEVVWSWRPGAGAKVAVLLTSDRPTGAIKPVPEEITYKR